QPWPSHPRGACPRSPSEARVLLGAPHEWARAPLGFAAGYSDLVRPHENPYGGPHAPAGLSGHPASELNLGNPAAESHSRQVHNAGTTSGHSNAKQRKRFLSQGADSLQSTRLAPNVSKKITAGQGRRNLLSRGRAKWNSSAKSMKL